MVKKFNLSVPDELAERIEARRDYLGSLSAIFQDAVAKKLQQKEDFERRIKEETSMEEVIERLKAEKTKAETDYFSKGKQDGLKWAKSASYTDLQYAIRFDPGELTAHGMMYPPDAILRDERLGDYFSEILETHPLMRPEDEDDILNDFAEEWLNGWIEAINAFWDEVSDKL